MKKVMGDICNTNGGDENADTALIRKPEIRRLLEKRKRRWDYSFKMKAS
jgi:hypothetical protein